MDAIGINPRNDANTKNKANDDANDQGIDLVPYATPGKITILDGSAKYTGEDWAHDRRDQHRGHEDHA